MFSFRNTQQDPACEAPEAPSPERPAAIKHLPSGELEELRQTAAALTLQLVPKEIVLRRARDRYEAGKEAFAKLDQALHEEQEAKISLQQVVVCRSLS
jgi:hypothetical protein